MKMVADTNLMNTFLKRMAPNVQLKKNYTSVKSYYNNCC